MSRSSYSDEYGDDFPGQLELFRANVARSIRSRKGQARLTELRDALEAMPVKELEANIFLRPSGAACALGVWASTHAANRREALEKFDGDDDETVDLLDPHGWPQLVVRDVIYVNDRDAYIYEKHEAPHQRPSDYIYSREGEAWSRRVVRPEKPAERHSRVLAWVNRQLGELR